MVDLKEIGQAASEKAILEAVRKAYRKLSISEDFPKLNKTSITYRLAADLNVSARTVEKYLSLAGLK